MGVKLIKQGDVWVTEFLGKLRYFHIDTDLVTWRSMGIVPGAALEFNVDLDGALLTVRNMATGEPVESLEIPKLHALADSIKATKLYVEGGMLEYITGVNLMLFFAVLLALGWGFISWLVRPVIQLNFSAYERTVETDGTRVKTRHGIEDGLVPLRSGNNEFYVIVRNNTFRRYPLHVAHLLHPIIRDSEDVLFFKVHVRVVGNQIAKFDATNLATASVQLIWSTV